MTVVATNQSKNILKSYEELWTKIRDQMRTINNKLDHYNEKYMKIKFSSDDGLPLNKTLFVRSVFEEGNKHFLQLFSDECLYTLAER